MAGGRVLAIAMEQVADPESFAATLRGLSGTSAEGHGNIDFADGRVAEHFSRPLVRSGVIDGRVWSFRDITARMESERARARLTAIIEATTDLVAITDVDGRRPVHERRRPAHARHRRSGRSLGRDG